MTVPFPEDWWQPIGPTPGQPCFPTTTTTNTFTFTAEKVITHSAIITVPAATVPELEKARVLCKAPESATLIVVLGQQYAGTGVEVRFDWTETYDA